MGRDIGAECSRCAVAIVVRRLRAARPVRVSLPGAVPARRRQGQRCPAAAGRQRGGLAGRGPRRWWL